MGTEPNQFCPKCGTGLPAQALFCMQCGARLAGSAPHADRFEYCRIEVVEERSKKRWYAEGIGPNGPFNAGTSNAWSSTWSSTAQDDKRKGPALHDLMTQLIADGWEPNPQGDGPDWYQKAFRRRSP
jgi:hypothetical protein